MVQIILVQAFCPLKTKIALFPDVCCLKSRLFLPGPVGDYRMPFEEEVGSHLSLEDMQQAVVHKKIRPKFRADWFHHNVR